MDEKQKKQIEIIHNALTNNQCDALNEVCKSLETIGKDILSGLSAYDIVSGNSEKMMAANAIMQIRNQVLLILTCCDE